ncbi:MAG TPA: hypothetical protein VGM39_11090 [Kofleriaceae bacterium]|jgi:hypothetical protein
MRTLAIASLLAASLVACGGGSGNGGFLGDDDRAPGGGDDTNDVDAGQSSSGKVGSIWVSSYSYSYPQTGTIQGASVSAQFYPETPSTWDPEDGGCVMTTYSTGAPTYPQTSAGTLTFGTSPPTTLVPSGSGTYTAAQMDHAISGNVSINAAGATVPAFTATVTVPTNAILTQPAIVAGKLTINRASDLVVKWTGGSGNVAVGVGYSYTGGSVFVNCTFAASAHQGTVPATMMSQLPSGSTGSFSATMRSQTSKDVGAWSIWIGATSSVNTTDGAAASATATLQ